MSIIWEIRLSTQRKRSLFLPLISHDATATMRLCGTNVVVVLRVAVSTLDGSVHGYATQRFHPFLLLSSVKVRNPVCLLHPLLFLVHGYATHPLPDNTSFFIFFLVSGTRFFLFFLASCTTIFILFITIDASLFLIFTVTDVPIPSSSHLELPFSSFSSHDEWWRHSCGRHIIGNKISIPYLCTSKHESNWVAF